MYDISNPGPVDIYNGELKLILGLIWTLIRRYQIRSTGRALSTKDALLAWINTQIPDQNIRNFTSNWNDGVALCALVDRVKPGVCPQYATLNRANKLENCSLGMELAESKLGIPKVIEPEDLSHPEIDDLSVMTYISYFCRPANEHLLHWVQRQLPDRDITNFQKDWNNGINLACLVEALCPGTFPNCRQLDPHDSLQNLVKAMKLGEDHLGVKPVIKPSQLADPSVDELNVVTYLSRYQYARPIPQPHEVTCSGNGLYKAFVGRPAFFDVDGTKGGVGDLDVLIKSKGGSPVSAEIKPHTKHAGMFEVKYVPHVPGKLTIEVKWSSFVIPSSPFNVDVLDPGALSFTGKQISGGQCAKVGKTVQMEAKGLADVADLYVMIQHPDGHTETAKIVDKGSGLAECSYIPVRVGKDEVFAKIAGTDLPGSPFEVKVVDPNQCSVALRDPPTGRAALVNKKVTFVVTAAGENLQGVIAEMKYPSGVQEVPISKQSDGSNTGSFTAIQVGKHEIMVTCAGENIRGSPITLEVSDPSKCAFLDTMPRYLQVKKPYQINLSTKGAGTGSVDALSSQAGILKAQMKKGRDNDLYTFDLSPSTVGESTITVKWNDQVIPPTPHTIFVCDASRCSAYGLGLTSGKGKIDEPFVFTVQVKGGGRGELTVKPKGPKTVYAADIKKNTDETYSVTFTTYEIGFHDIDILWGGEHIPNSPYKVDFNRGTDVSKISVRGPGLKGAVANRRAEVTVYARESKLIENGVLNISFKSASGKETDIDLYDNNNGTYNVSYTPRDAGTLTLIVTGAGEQVAGSPFNIEVKPEPQAHMCTIVGKGGSDVFQDGSECCQVLGKALELTVDTTSAGTGSLTVSGIKPDKTTLRVFTTDETQRGKKVSFLKFEPTVVGTHHVSVLWDDTHIPRSPFKVHVVNPSKCIPEGGIPSYLKVRETRAILFATQGSGPGKLEVKSKTPFVTANMKENKQAVLTGAKLGKSEVQVTFGGYPIPGSPFEVSVCDPTKCSMDLSSLRSQSHFVGVPFSFNVNAKDAGVAKLQVKPASAKYKYNIDVKEMGRGIWKVTCTAWSVGTQELLLKWGDWDISGSPFKFSVSDPKKIVISGLPDPQNYIPIIGEPISFTVDCSEAGSGTLTSKARLEDGTEKELEREETDSENKMASLQFVPSQPGKLELLLQFNGVNILPAVRIYEVPDPSRFQVTPPKGFGKLKEYVKFPITGVTKETDLKITARRPEHDATVKLEPGKDENTKIARFTPKHIGEYTIQVKHKGQNIDGSPFTVQIAHPDGCHPIGELPSTIHIGDKSAFEIDTSKAGPGSLSFYSESLSGDVEPYISPSEDTKYSIYLEQGLGKSRVTMKWADYAIPSSPFTVSFVDSSQVLWECESLKDGLVKQGEVVMIRLDCTNAGYGIPEVRARGPQSRYPVQQDDNNDGTFTIPLNPWQVGDNVVEILYGGHSIPNSPIQFEVVKPVEAHTITATGEGLSHMIAGVSATVAINTPDPGLLDRGLLKAKFLTEGDEEEEIVLPSIDLKDTGTGRYDLTLLSQDEGEFSLDISCEEKPIVGSPFKIHVSPASCSDKCFAYGPALEKNAKLVVNDPVKFTIDSTNAGSGGLKATATQPNGEDIQIYKHDEEGAAILHHLKFDPEIVGVHKVHVSWDGVDIPGSPFDFNVLDPSKVKVNGLPPAPNGLAYIEVPINFAVTMTDSGASSPVVYVDPPGDDNPTLLSGDPTSSSVLEYEFTPSNFGAHIISIEVGGTDVPGSPFKVNVVDPNKFSISGLNLKGDYALVCELVSIYISGNASDGETLAVTAHGPSADLNVDTVNEGNGKYRANFVPIEPGCYEMFVEYAGAHVNGSPFTVQVADPSKCQVLGDVPTVVQVGKSEEFVVKTRGAGVGDLMSLVEEEASIGCEIVNQGLETYSVILTGNKVDEVSLDLQWAGFPIPQSPFGLNVCDADQCKAFGQALVAKKGKAGEAITFSVVTENAGKGKLSVVAKGPSAQYNIDIKETKDDTYEVTFTPWEVGAHTIEILWGNTHIPRSPYTINVDNPMDVTVCNATGEGLKTAIVGQTATFMIISSEVGLLEKNALKVSVLGVQSHADVVVKDNNNGCYAVEYVAPTPGAYVASISFYDRQIPGSPFKVNVFPGPDASKCFAYGPALNQNSILIAGSPLELFVDTSEGGFGQLRVYIQGPNDYRPKVFMANDDKGIYSIKFDAMKSGKYFVVVAWSEEHIPGSPFKLKVHPAADASKVRAYGPGLLDSFLGAPGLCFAISFYL